MRIIAHNIWSCHYERSEVISFLTVERSKCRSVKKHNKSALKAPVPHSGGSKGGVNKASPEAHDTFILLHLCTLIHLGPFDFLGGTSEVPRLRSEEGVVPQKNQSRANKYQLGAKRIEIEAILIPEQQI